LGSNQDWKGQHVELDVKAHFMKRYNELCPRVIKLTNKASGTQEAYTFFSKVCEEADKIIDDMLTKKNVDGESSGMAHVSISIANDEIDTIGMAKGIKKRQEKPRGKRKREQSWVEKLAGKTKKCSNSRNAPVISLSVYCLCLAYIMSFI
jgi:hypothetical protein